MITPNPKVSIIIPTYNRANLIKDAIKSVLVQKTSFEIIVVDDCSTENITGIVSSFEDDRIRYLRLKEKGGAQVARNFGIKQAKGELITFLDSDDIMLPGTLSCRVDYFENNSLCQCSYSDFQVCFVGSRRNHIKNIKVGYTKPDLIHKEVLRKLSLAPMIVFMAKREVFQKVGYMDIALPSGHDDDTYIRFSKKGTCHYIPVYAVCAIQHAGESICRDPVRFAEGRRMLIEKYKDEIITEVGQKILRNHYILNTIDFWAAKNTHKAGIAFKKAAELGIVSSYLWLPVFIAKRYVRFLARLLRKKVLRLL